jgi:DNA-directed RNA polymerase specialized sigma24 family protein/CheY-like chemotaxis protein
MASLASDLERLLPELRRYAFELTGTTRIGDDLVEACMRAAAEGPDRLDRLQLRRSLYRLFHEVNPRIPIGTTEEPRLPVMQDRLLNYLLGLPLPDRAILALHATSGFSQDAIADILDLPLERVCTLLTSTRQRLAGAELARVLIIEDDYILASDMAYAIEQGGQGVCGPAGTCAEAIRCASENAPTVIIADVQLRDGQFAGIEAAEAISETHDVPVIFVTAFPERVVREAAGRSPSVLTKPVDHQTLRSTIARALAAPSNLPA